MDDLINFLQARIAEDELWALAASAPYAHADGEPRVPAGGVHWTWAVGEDWKPARPDPVTEATVGGPEYYGCNVNLISTEQWPTALGTRMPAPVANQMVEVKSGPAGHIARHDPARVLREVEAKRRILALHEELNEPHLYEAVQHLAAVWSDHPGYRPEWAVEHPEEQQ